MMMHDGPCANFTQTTQTSPTLTLPDRTVLSCRAFIGSHTRARGATVEIDGFFHPREKKILVMVVPTTPLGTLRISECDNFKLGGPKK